MGVRDGSGSNGSYADGDLQESPGTPGWFGNNFITGIPGTGKSFKSIELVSRKPRVIYFDSVKQAAPGPRRQNVLPADFVQIYQPDDLAEFLRPVQRSGSFRVHYIPQTNREQHFDQVCTLAYHCKNLILVVDEIHLYCTAGSTPEPLKDIATTGRHPGVSLVFTSQRPQLVSTDLRDTTTCFRIFKLGVNGMKYFAPIIDPEDLSKIRSLPFRHYLQVDEERAFSRLITP